MADAKEGLTIANIHASISIDGSRLHVLWWWIKHVDVDAGRQT